MTKTKPPLTLKTKGGSQPLQLPDAQAINAFVGSSKDSQQSSLVTMPMSTQNNQTKTFPLVLSAEVHQKIVAAARRDGKSLKEFIMTAVFERMERNA